MITIGNAKGHGKCGLNEKRKGPQAPFPRVALKMHAGVERGALTVSKYIWSLTIGQGEESLGRNGQAARTRNWGNLTLRDWSEGERRNKGNTG